MALRTGRKAAGISTLSLAELSGPIFSVQLIMDGGPHWMIVINPTRISGDAHSTGLVARAPPACSSPSFVVCVMGVGSVELSDRRSR